MNHTIRVAFCGVLAGLGLALMFLTALLPMATFALPALAGLLMIMIVIEMGARWAWPTFAVVAILSVFFVPDKQAALLYVIFFGYYPILKALIERLKNKIVQWVLKYAVFNAAIVSAYFIAIYLLSIPADSLSLFGVSLPWVFWIAGNVIFYGTTTKVPQLLWAMDVYLMPSLYEGLPVTGIEAQAAALPLLVSDTVSRELQVTDLVRFMSLQSTADEWARMAIKISELPGKREENYISELERKGYDIRGVAKQLEAIYEKRN